MAAEDDGEPGALSGRADDDEPLNLAKMREMEAKEDAAAKAKLDKMRALLLGVDASLASAALVCNEHPSPSAGALSAWERFARYPTVAGKANAAANAAPSAEVEPMAAEHEEDVD